MSAAWWLLFVCFSSGIFVLVIVFFFFNCLRQGFSEALVVVELTL